jgi:hypothetical protein
MMPLTRDQHASLQILNHAQLLKLVANVFAAIRVTCASSSLAVRSTSAQSAAQTRAIPQIRWKTRPLLRIRYGFLLHSSFLLASRGSEVS